MSVTSLTSQSLQTETRSLSQTPDEQLGDGSGALNGLQEAQNRNDDDVDDEEETVHSLTGQNTKHTSVHISYITKTL